MILKNMEISFWKKLVGKYELTKGYKRYFGRIENVNDLTFLSLSNNTGHGVDIILYDKDNCDIIKSFSLNRVITFIGYNGNKDIVVFISLEQNIGFYCYIYNIKHYEIIQIFEYKKVHSSFLLFNNQFIFEIFYEDQKKQIQINNFSVEDGCFNDYISLKKEDTYDSTLSLTHDNYLFLENRNELIIYNILEKENSQEGESQIDKYKKKYHDWFIRHSNGEENNFKNNKNEYIFKSKEQNLNREKKDGEKGIKDNKEKYENWFFRHSEK